jgi:hypothetical protein
MDKKERDLDHAPHQVPLSTSSECSAKPRRGARWLCFLVGQEIRGFEGVLNAFVITQKLMLVKRIWQ